MSIDHLPADASGAGLVPAPDEPGRGAWERRARIMLSALDSPGLPAQAAATFVAGWMVAVYRHGYWDAKLAEVQPCHRCNHCGRVSHHPDDVSHGYCPGCHHFCADVAP